MIYAAPIKDMMFLVDELIGMDNITSLPGYEDLDSEALQFILEEAGKFCTNELLSINRQGDKYGATFTDGVVRAPPGFKEAYKEYIENGWTSIDADPDHGGQGLPKLTQFLVDEMLSATNLAFKLYSELSHGAYHLLASCASDDIRKRFLPKMVQGVWSGTMCLTEPHCGTDLGLLTTKASVNEDDTYKISGTKIFITSGDHDLTDNILHLVLARIDDAPAGSRGISLFLVPRTWVNKDGSLGERNSVSTGSIEHKMGIRGSATCVLNFEGARGLLIGQENRGLAAMFKMMNIERITVGIQGLGIAEIAYQNALLYARERLQSRAPPPRPDDSKPADPIVFQPEIKRMLLNIRSQVEGARALAVYTGHHVDLMERSVDDEQKADAENIVALLTPVTKSFLADLGVSSSLSAQQVFGGHGYVSEHGMEQLVRDSRITQIYEGTNEVQATDLVMRKLTGNTGRFAERFLENWAQYLEQQLSNEIRIAYAEPAAVAVTRLRNATTWITGNLDSGSATALGAAVHYQRLFALTMIACLWVRVIASIRDKNGSFYDTKRKTARFYMEQVLPETAMLHEIITTGADSLREFEITDFAN